MRFVSFLCVQNVVFCGSVFSWCFKCSGFMERVVLAVGLFRVDTGSALVMRFKISGCYVLFMLSLCWGER